MYSYDIQMSQIHALLAWSAVALFVVRGLAFQFGAAWPKDTRLGVLVFSVAVLLSVTGLSLWVLRHFNPFRDGWLMAKLLALLVYTECAHVAMVKGKFHVLGYLTALLLLAYMMAASITRSPWLGLF